MRFFQGPHTQYRAHHSQTRVCARLIGLSYAQLRQRREFGRGGGFGEVARCVPSGDHVCGMLSVCAVTVESIEYQPVSRYPPPAHIRESNADMFLRIRPSDGQARNSRWRPATRVYQQGPLSDLFRPRVLDTAQNNIHTRPGLCLHLYLTLAP